MNKEQINQSIAYIQDGDKYFQIRNDNGDDWNEEATSKLYQDYLNNK